MRYTLLAGIVLLVGGCTGTAPVADESGVPGSCPADTTVLAMAEDWNSEVAREPTTPNMRAVQRTVSSLVQQDAERICPGAAELADAELALDRVNVVTGTAAPADWQSATTAIEAYLEIFGISPTVLTHPDVHTPPGFPMPPLERGSSTTPQQP